MKRIMISRTNFFERLARHPWLAECITQVTDFTVYCTVTPDQFKEMTP